MDAPLIWNFIIQEQTGTLTEEAKIEPESLLWEIRFFWPDQVPIYLHNIDPKLKHLEYYKAKQREDRYYLLPNTPYNIKYRREKLLYKPLVKQSKLAQGFGPKIDLNDPETYPKKGPITADILEKIRYQVLQEGCIIPVNKEAYLYKFPTHPTTKLELSRLQVKQAVYFSLCIQGRNLQAVEDLAAQLLDKGNPCDYVQFLQGL